MLRKLSQSKPSIGPSRAREAFRDLLQRPVEDADTQLNQLREVSTDTASLQDLVEHCLQMQQQHRARIHALEARLEGYGYKPMPVEHELELEEASDIFDGIGESGDRNEGHQQHESPDQDLSLDPVTQSQLSPSVDTSSPAASQPISDVDELRTRYREASMASRPTETPPSQNVSSSVSALSLSPCLRELQQKYALASAKKAKDRVSLESVNAPQDHQSTQDGSKHHPLAGIGRKLDYLSLESPTLQMQPSKRSSVGPLEHLHLADVTTLPRLQHTPSADQSLGSSQMRQPAFTAHRTLPPSQMHHVRPALNPSAFDQDSTEDLRRHVIRENIQRTPAPHNLTILSAQFPVAMPQHVPAAPSGMPHPVPDRLRSNTAAAAAGAGTTQAKSALLSSPPRQSAAHPTTPSTADLLRAAHSGSQRGQASACGHASQQIYLQPQASAEERCPEVTSTLAAGHQLTHPAAQPAIDSSAPHITPCFHPAPSQGSLTGAAGTLFNRLLPGQLTRADGLPNTVMPAAHSFESRVSNPVQPDAVAADRLPALQPAGLGSMHGPAGASAVRGPSSWRPAVMPYRSGCNEQQSSRTAQTQAKVAAGWPPASGPEDRPMQLSNPVSGVNGRQACMSASSAHTHAGDAAGRLPVSTQLCMPMPHAAAHSAVSWPISTGFAGTMSAASEAPLMSQCLQTLHAPSLAAAHAASHPGADAGAANAIAQPVPPAASQAATTVPSCSHDDARAAKATRPTALHAALDTHGVPDPGVASRFPTHPKPSVSQPSAGMSSEGTAVQAPGPSQVSALTQQEYEAMPVRFSRHLPLDQINAALAFISERGSAGVQPGDLEAAGGRLWTSTMLSCLMALKRVKGMTINGHHAYYPC
ncbi:hypothetical protein WJX74_005200 [Apatococcus lobatus]|uniref:Spindle and kinetochore-associated protein 3 n=1 Tax=Apatococcus lobatus TaxID=904363 RepID=A0AAW1S5Q4_9CHLO